MGKIDLLTCPKACPEPVEGCQGSKRIISVIEDREVIKAILKNLGLWLVKSKPAPKAHAPPARNRDDSEPVEIVLEHFCQLSLNDDHLHRDPDYPWESYLQS